MLIHLFFDLLSYLIAFLVAKFYIKGNKKLPNGDLKWYYYTAVIVGFVLGAIAFSTINNYLSLDTFTVGKSIIGAIFGAIVAVEVFKFIYKIEGSTGAYFVPSLAIGIAVGRLGCFFAGLPDFTYGVETTLPWGVDFGDGIKRHPVQLYESASMFGFFIFSVVVFEKNRVWFEKYIFYLFILFYATQRFSWELLKPYAKIGYFNIFGWLSLVLIAYALFQIKRSKNGTL